MINRSLLRLQTFGRLDLKPLVCQRYLSPPILSQQIISPKRTFVSTPATKSLKPDNYQTVKKPKPSTLGKVWLKIKRASSFTFFGSLILGASGLSAVVIYLIGSELFSPSGDTVLFNRAVSMVEKDPQVRELLQCNDKGWNERLQAYGERHTHDKWTMNRPISSHRKVDENGKVHYFLRFHLESKKKVGLVHLEAVESEDKFSPDFVTLYIDIPGERRYFLIKPKLKQIKRPIGGLLGINWGQRKDK